MLTLAQVLYAISLLGFLFSEAVAGQEPAHMVVGPNVRVSGDAARPYVEMMIAVNPADPDNLVGASMRSPHVAPPRGGGRGSTLGDGLPAERDVRMMEELDSVVLTRDIPESGLSEGDVGTVVHRYGDGEGYEVEFVTGEGRTVAVLTLTVADLRPLKDEDILHVRKLASA